MRATHSENRRFVDDEHVPGRESNLSPRQFVQEHVHLKRAREKLTFCIISREKLKKGGVVRGQSVNKAGFGLEPK